MKRLSILFLLLMTVSVNAQNVGIGTNTPDQSSKLDISATDRGLLVPRVALVQTTSSSPVTTPATSLLVYNTASVNDVTPGYYYWSGAAWTRVSTGNAGWSLTGNAGTSPVTNFIGTTDLQDFAIRTNNTERVRVLNNGNMGIGTASPSTFITARKDHNNPTTLMIQNATAGSISEAALLLQTNSGSLDFEAISSAYSGFGVLVPNTGRVRSSTGMAGGLYVGTGNGPVVFFTGDTERARLTAMGEFGVGITNPLSKISAGSSYGNKIAAYDDGANVAGLGVQAGLLQMYTSNNTSDIVFGFGSSSVFTENVRIKGTGNVGIGTNAPNQRLSVRGGIEIENSFDNVITSRNMSTGLNHHVIGTFQGWDSRGIFLAGYNVNNPGGAYDAASRVYCGGPAGTIPISATAFTVVSAGRFKEDVLPLSHGLSTVMQLNPVQYKYNFEALKQTHMGLIAEEVNAIVPEVVVKQNEQGQETIDQEGTAMGINYTELVPILIKAMQEQQAEIEGLKERILELEGN